jgi:hypothetical protein
MKTRYGREVTGKCQICGHEGNTDIHHIVSKAKISRIVPGKGRASHGHDLNLMTNPGNLAELCGKCHKLTDSHIYWRMHELLDELRGDKEATKKKRRKMRQAKREAKWATGKLFQCAGQTRSGRRCNITVDREGAKCGAHRDRCLGVTMKGRPCRVKKVLANGYCKAHQKQVMGSAVIVDDDRVLEEWEEAEIELQELLEYTEVTRDG